MTQQVAHDAAIAGRVFHVLGEQRQLAVLCGLGQAFEGGGADQRHVTIENEGGDAVVQQRHGLGDGMAGAQLGRLFGPVQVGLALEGGLHLFATMAEHDDQPLGVEGAGGVDDMAEQGFAGQGVQNFRQVGVHPFAHAGSQDHDVHLGWIGV